MKYDIEALSKKYGYIKDTLEKTLRLSNILSIIYSTEWKNKVVLKGGTCINLFYRDLPRLSVDIDLDYIGKIDKEEMLREKEQFFDFLVSRLEMEGYYLSQEKTKRHYALDSIVLKYTNKTGNNDNIKIETNFMDRTHILPTNQKAIKNKIVNENVKITILCEEEVYASKVAALLNRATPRDLFDVSLMLKESKLDKTLLKKCTVFYNSISGDTNLLDNKKFDKIEGITKNEVFKYLIPLLKKGQKFDREAETKFVVENLKSILEFTDNEKEFIVDFGEGKYSPSKLFDDTDVIKNLEKHPMALFRVSKLS